MSFSTPYQLKLVLAPMRGRWTEAPCCWAKAAREDRQRRNACWLIWGTAQFLEGRYFCATRNASQVLTRPAAAGAERKNMGEACVCPSLRSPNCLALVYSS